MKTIIILDDLKTNFWGKLYLEFMICLFECLNIVLIFPPAVQHECIPQAILGMDVLCQAKSGMGKTAVFVLSTLQQLEPVEGQVCENVLTVTNDHDMIAPSSMGILFIGFLKGNVHWCLLKIIVSVKH